MLACALPVHAGLLSGASLIQVAQIVLKGKALLGKGQSQCGSQVGVSTKDNLLMTAAGAAVQKSLPAPKFNAMSLLANRQASAAAAKPNFCAQTAAKKPGIMTGIASAAGKLGVGGGGPLGGLGGMLGGAGSGGGNPLGGMLGGGSSAPPSSNPLGGLLGN
ncbi:MAG: hypothetical protein KGQ42_10335 [Alphaproteobacteria bacterium]|nr:hypothetical protein [Alphaproteobacteria bacterium]